MSTDLATLAADPERIESLPPDALPGLIGEAAALQARLWARLQSAGAPGGASPDQKATPEGDELLTAAQAAALLGVDRRWVYRKAKAGALPFTRKLSSGTVRFSSRGLERWKEARR